MLVGLRGTLAPSPLNPLPQGRGFHRERQTSVPRTPNQIPATYMRGGTSKVCFPPAGFYRNPASAGQGARCLLLRVIGSPDPYAKQIDGMGGATSSTSKTVILAKSSKPDHDVDYLFGQVGVDQTFVDWRATAAI